MTDITKPVKDVAVGLKKVNQPKTFYMVAGATAGLLVSVLVFTALLGGRPSFTPKIISVPIPTDKGGL